MYFHHHNPSKISFHRHRFQSRLLMSDLSLAYVPELQIHQCIRYKLKAMNIWSSRKSIFSIFLVNSSNFDSSTRDRKFVQSTYRWPIGAKYSCRKGISLELGLNRFRMIHDMESIIWADSSNHKIAGMFHIGTNKSNHWILSLMDTECSFHWCDRITQCIHILLCSILSFMGIQEFVLWLLGYKHCLHSSVILTCINNQSEAN